MAYEYLFFVLPLTVFASDSANVNTSGNILSVKAYQLTAEGVTPSGSYTLTSYGYSSDGWGDKLKSFNGQAITYDSIGNPLTYYNGSSYSFTWQGRQLVGATKGDKTMSFEYNADGIRTSKTVNGVTTKYYLNGTQIVADVNPNYSIMYIYDADGSPIGMQYRASSYAENVFDYYFFEKNLQGDIVAVYGKDGTNYLEYFYDAWGNFQIGYHNAGNLTPAALNPFAYRGYYYDSDLNLYYLNSRYYDSNVRRFISPDTVGVLSVTPMSLTDKNLYAYCDNNPITRVDNGGEFWHIIAGAVVGAVVGAVKSVVKQVKTGGEINWGSVLVSAGAGAVSGAAASTGIGAVGQVAINSFASATESYLTQGIENGFSNIDYGEVVVSAIEGGVSAIGNGQTKGNAKYLLTQGNTATKQLKQKGLVKTAKYYWSQTKNIFYKPLMKKTFSLQATAKWVLYNDAKYFAEQLLQR